MTSPHDRPTAQELLESVAEWIERDLAPSLSGAQAFHARVARNILEMVGREIDTADVASAAQDAMWSALGVASNAELCDRIGAGEFDSSMHELIGHLRPVVRHKVQVANPRHLQD